MPTHNISLSDHYDQFINEQVATGRYQDANEVLRAGLQLLEQQSQTDEQKLAILQKLAKEGFDELDQGLGVAFENEQQLTDAINEIGERAGLAAKR